MVTVGRPIAANTSLLDLRSFAGPDTLSVSCDASYIRAGDWSPGWRSVSWDGQP